MNYHRVAYVHCNAKLSQPSDQWDGTQTTDQEQSLASANSQTMFRRTLASLPLDC